MPAGKARLEFQIVLDRQARDQVELLEHEAEPITAQFGAPGVREIGERRIGQSDLPILDQMQHGRRGGERLG